MHMQYRVFLSLLLLPLAAGTASAQYQLARDVFGSGGSMQGNTQYQCRGTLGQPAIGPAAAEGFHCGAGFWYTTGTVVSVPGIEAWTPTSLHIESLYPQPVRETAWLRYSVSETGSIQLKLFDLLGREVALLIEVQHVPGSYVLHWDASQLLPGVYFVQLRGIGSVDVRRIAVVR